MLQPKFDFSTLWAAVVQMATIIVDRFWTKCLSYHADEGLVSIKFDTESPLGLKFRIVMSTKLFSPPCRSCFSGCLPLTCCLPFVPSSLAPDCTPPPYLGRKWPSGPLPSSPPRTMQTTPPATPMRSWCGPSPCCSWGGIGMSLVGVSWRRCVGVVVGWVGVTGW